MSKNQLSEPAFDEIPTYFHLDFENDRYEFVHSPLLEKLSIDPEGSMYDLETKALLYDSLRAYCSIIKALSELYANGMEGDSEMHLLMYFLSADRKSYIPLSVRITHIWNKETRWADEAVGAMRLAKGVAPIARCSKIAA